LSGASPVDISQASMLSSISGDSTPARNLNRIRLRAISEMQELRREMEDDNDEVPSLSSSLSDLSNMSSPATRATAPRDQVFSTTPLRSNLSQPPSAPPSPGVSYFKLLAPSRTVTESQLIPTLGPLISSKNNFETQWAQKVNRATSSNDLWELLRGLFDPATSPLFFYQELPKQLSALPNDINFGGDRYGGEMTRKR